MKKNVVNVLVLLGVFLLCVAFSLILFFAGNNAFKDTPVRKKDSGSSSVNTVSILDISGVMKMTAVNYLPDKFAGLSETVTDENDGKELARRGTYRFCIDTLAMDEWTQSESLNCFLKPDGNWHLTMYIPPVFAACSVFVQHENKEYVGAIGGYNIDYYLNYSAPSEFDGSVFHQTATKPMFLDIPISSDGKYSKECKVTIHYEADNENFVGLFGPVLIGEDSAVRGAVAQNRAILLGGAVVGAGTLLIFLLICILKRSFSFIPQLLFAVGIFSAMFSTYALFGSTAFPYLMLGIRRFSAGFLLFAAALYLPKKVAKVPVLYPISGLAFAATVLAFISPFCTGAVAYTAVCYTYIVLAFVCIAVVFAFTMLDVYKNKPLGLRLNTVLAGVSAVMALFARQPVPFIMLSPAFWLYFGVLGITLVLGLREFITAEIHNRYLTTNLEHEVERQTQNLQKVLAERDNILLYVSHDMKRTVAGMGDALTDLRQKLGEAELSSKGNGALYAPEADSDANGTTVTDTTGSKKNGTGSVTYNTGSDGNDLIAKVDYLLQKNAELKKDFADLGKYGKQNYMAEQSDVVNLSAIVLGVTDDLRPDCEANGIILTVSVSDTLKVYAKKVALESVIQNLVLNAIEHSYCSHLSVSATKRKGFCRLEIVDDGRGITTDKDVFAPFVSGEPSESNSGLGLFLARNAIETMHGELTYARRDNLTVFSATLPLA